MKLILKSNKLRALLGGHPWVLDGSLLPFSQTVEDGSIVDIYTEKDRFFARGLYNGHSKIRVRLYTWNENTELNSDFWTKKLESAIQLRKDLGYFNEGESGQSGAPSCRLANSEGDGLSGLIVDQYGDVLSVQATALGIWRRAEELAGILMRLTGAKSVMFRAEPGMAKREGIVLDNPDGLLFGLPVPEKMVISSGGILYELYLSGGQKTGFYLDQKENRQAAGRLMANRDVLDMYCYHGGFSLAASKAGAKSCLACDSSAKALEQAQVNAQLNGAGNIQFQQGDAFEILESFKAQERLFGGVILDPPKFAQGKRSASDALRGYHYLNKLGIACIAPGGFLVTCSCTGSVSREDFFAMLHGAASQAGRSVQILQQRGAGLDHPVSDACPESEYLKCFLCRVE